MECEEVQASIDAYALGALDPSEREEFERHTERCPECRDATERAALSAASLGLTAPLRHAPRELHARIMHQVALEADPPAATPLHRLRARSPERQSSDVQSLFAAAGRQKRRYWRWMQPLAASLAVLLLIGSAIWIIRMQAQLNRLQARSQSLQRGLQDFEGQRAALMLLASEGTVRYEMQPSSPDTGTAGAVIWNPDRHVCSIFVSGLPAAPAGQSYHVWLVGDQRSWDSGELSPSSEGTAEKTIDLRTMSKDAGYQVVVSLHQQQDAGNAWQPVLKAWIGIQ
jgi:hypothetical protein